MKICPLFIATIAILNLLVQTPQAVNNDTRISKWFLFGNNLFYIESQQKFISTEAQQHCIDIKMDNVIQTEELVGLSKLLIKKYEFDIACWVLDEDFSSWSHNNNNNNASQCYALNIRGIYSEDCWSLRGVICKQNAYGGSLQYKDGSQLEVGVSGVNHFCNPESNRYDEMLQFCLIKLNMSSSVV